MIKLNKNNKVLSKNCDIWYNIITE
jgi:hypothetical protein